MRPVVAVWDPLPLFQEALTRALEGANLHVTAPRDILAYARRETPAVIVVTVNEQDPRMIVDLRQASPETEIVVLLTDTSLASYQWAIEAGATAPVLRTAEAGEVVNAVQAALDHRTVLPAEIARALVRERRGARAGYSISREEIEWLRALAEGLTVAGTAERFGMSERGMYRRLRAIYKAMGVSGRVEAIARAIRLGWF